MEGLHKSVIARSEATWRSIGGRLASKNRLLRYARNDRFGPRNDGFGLMQRFPIFFIDCVYGLSATLFQVVSEQLQNSTSGFRVTRLAFAVQHFDGALRAR